MQIYFLGSLMQEVSCSSWHLMLKAKFAIQKTIKPLFSKHPSTNYFPQKVLFMQITMQLREFFAWCRMGTCMMQKYDLIYIAKVLAHSTAKKLLKTDQMKCKLHKKPMIYGGLILNIYLCVFICIYVSTVHILAILFIFQIYFYSKKTDVYFTKNKQWIKCEFILFFTFFIYFSYFGQFMTLLSTGPKKSVLIYYFK